MDLKSYIDPVYLFLVGLVIAGALVGFCVGAWVF